MKRRLVITTEIISPYRIPVFNVLAEHPDVDLHVIFLAETDPSMRRWKIYKDEIRFSYEVLPHWRRRVAGYNVLLNRGVASALDQAQPDVIVCGGYGYLASWQVLGWARRLKRRVFLWSESNQQDQRRGMPHVEMLKRRFIADCSGFVVPGKSAAAYVATFGVPRERIFVAPNAVDNAFFAQQASVARSRAAELRRQFGLPERYFLCVGRLVFSKGVFDLLDAYSQLAPELRAAAELAFRWRRRGATGTRSASRRDPSRHHPVCRIRPPRAARGLLRSSRGTGVPYPYRPVGTGSQRGHGVRHSDRSDRRRRLRRRSCAGWMERLRCSHKRTREAGGGTGESCRFAGAKHDDGRAQRTTHRAEFTSGLRCRVCRRNEFGAG